MEIVDKIRNHPLYKECYEKLLRDEEERVFCRHNLAHFLDVARIAYIKNLEEDLNFSKEIIYATAFLHDIGKCYQYEQGVPHEIASAKVALEILTDQPQISEIEKQEMVQAIKEHRRETREMSKLGRLIYESDKLSRACYQCSMEKECNWSEAQKNRVVTY